MWSAFCCRCFCFDMSSNRNLFHCEFSHTDTERVERKTAFELCEVVFALSIFPEASLQLQEEAKGERGDTSLLQSLICLTPSHPPFTPSPWRKRAARRGPREFTSFSQLGHVIIYLLGAFYSLLPSRERRGRGDICL